MKVKITSSALKSRVGVNLFVEWNLTPLRSLEGVFQPVGRHVPAFGQRRPDFGGAGLELDKAVIDRVPAGGVEGRRRL